MDAAGLFAVFVLVLVLVSVASHRYRVPPFFALVGGALLFGLLAGLGLEQTVEGSSRGIGRVFSAFGIIILSGAVIAKVLETEGWIDGIVADVRRFVRDPVAASGLLGYLLAVPFTCCITAFVALAPILSAMGDGDERRRSGLLYLAALGSLVELRARLPDPGRDPARRGLRRRRARSPSTTRSRSRSRSPSSCSSSSSPGGASARPRRPRRRHRVPSTSGRGPRSA